MAVVQTTYTLLLDVANAASVAIPYPPGYSAADFNAGDLSAIAVVADNNQYSQGSGDIGISYGASTITVTNTSGSTWLTGQGVRLVLSTTNLMPGAGVPILSAATAGQDSGWVVYRSGERLAYALDSGSTTTTFSVDISNDGAVSLGQVFTGTWASTTAEISPPLYLTNTQTRFIRFNVLSGGPLSVIKF